MWSYFLNIWKKYWNAFVGNNIEFFFINQEKVTDLVIFFVFRNIFQNHEVFFSLYRKKYVLFSFLNVYFGWVLGCARGPFSGNILYIIRSEAVFFFSWQPTWTGNKWRVIYTAVVCVNWKKTDVLIIRTQLMCIRIVAQFVWFNILMWFTWRNGMSRIQGVIYIILLFCRSIVKYPLLDHCILVGQCDDVWWFLVVIFTLVTGWQL